MTVELTFIKPIANVEPAAASLLKLLSDPTRRRVFLALMRGETCNCELRDELGLKENLISHHLRQLRDAGFVLERRDELDARWVYYRLDAGALGRAWAALGAAVDPERIGTRTPSCGPSAKSCC
jgi:DNA-binding transcriptional ArsR family regulator